MRRRDLIIRIGGAAGWPFAARAQWPKRLRRIDVLTPGVADDPARKFITFPGGGDIDRELGAIAMPLGSAIPAEFVRLKEDLCAHS